VPGGYSWKRKTEVICVEQERGEEGALAGGMAKYLGKGGLARLTTAGERKRSLCRREGREGGCRRGRAIKEGARTINSDCSLR